VQAKSYEEARAVSGPKEKANAGLGRKVREEGVSSYARKKTSAGAKSKGLDFPIRRLGREEKRTAILPESTEGT